VRSHGMPSLDSFAPTPSHPRSHPHPPPLRFPHLTADVRQRGSKQSSSGFR
jgi:hypothetical protein